MREFFLYTLKQEYINRYADIEPRLLDSKGIIRPSICLKDKKGYNWLLPVTSLNPDKENYNSKIMKINWWSGLEKSFNIKAIMRIQDITGKKHNNDFESVLQFFNVLPVKNAYVHKYFRKNKHIAADLTFEQSQQIKLNFYNYMTNYYRGNVSGFLWQIQKNGKNIAGYQYKSKEIRRELFKKHDAQKRMLQKKKKSKDIFTESKEHKKELKRCYLQLTVEKFTNMGRDPNAAEADAKHLLPKAEENLARKVNDALNATEAVKTEQSTYEKVIVPSQVNQIKQNKK